MKTFARHCVDHSIFAKQTRLSFLFCHFVPINHLWASISLCFPASPSVSVPKALTRAAVIPSDARDIRGKESHRRERKHTFTKLLHDWWWSSLMALYRLSTQWDITLWPSYWFLHALSQTYNTSPDPLVPTNKKHKKNILTSVHCPTHWSLGSVLWNLINRLHYNHCPSLFGLTSWQNHVTVRVPLTDVFGPASGGLDIKTTPEQG